MRYIFTAEELLDQYAWEEFCEDRGINIWAINEGLMDSDEEFVLSEEEVSKYGLVIHEKLERIE